MPIKKDGDLATCGGSILMIGCLILFIGWLAEEPDKRPATSSRVATTLSGTINGYDPATKTIINPINVFKDYENRNLGISGKAKHGEKVTILEKSGTGVKVRTNSGVTGWVSNWFVRND